jgi:hypothetical protein
MLPLAVGVRQHPSRLWHCVKDLSRRFQMRGPAAVAKLAGLFGARLQCDRWQQCPANILIVRKFTVVL